MKRKRILSLAKKFQTGAWSKGSSFPRPYTPDHFTVCCSCIFPLKKEKKTRRKKGGGPQKGSGRGR